MIALPFSVSGQTDSHNDSIATILKLFPSNLDNEELNNYLQIDKSSEIKFESFKPEFQPTLPSGNDRMKAMIPTVNVYYYPTINLSPTNSYIPLGNDYSLHATYPLADGLYLSSYSGSREYLGMGGIRRVDASLGYEPTDWMTISAGPYVSKYAINNNQFDDYGVSGALRFKAGERIRFNVYGQYSGAADKNNIGGPMSSMFNPTYYGGTIEFKVNDTFGIEAGMLRELNPFTGKWVNTPIITPVFYGGGKKRR